MIKFSLILASRNRTYLLANLISSLKSSTKNINQIELIVICDDDDKDTMNFKTDINFKLLSRPRSKYMHRDYLNWAYPYAEGDYIIVLNDDTEFVTKDWDEIDLTDVYYGFIETYTGEKLCCFPLLSRKAIDSNGFIMPNERKSWGADHDIFHIFNNVSVNKVKRLPMSIIHISHHTNLREKDEINQRVQDIHDWNLNVPVGYYADRCASKLIKIPITDPKDILVIYNICGISKKENHDYYCQSINSILSQKGNFRLVISGCFVDEKIKKILHERFGSKISYLWIDDKLPLNITFNYAVKKSIEIFGKHKTYLYVDSGVTFGNDRNVIEKMYNRIQKGYAMVAAQVDSDDGYGLWGIKITNEDYVIPVGKAVNLHCQMFHNDILETYNNILPDIFASDTSESVFTFLCSAINKEWIIVNDVKLHHLFNMDGASSGFRGKHNILFKSNKTIEQICEEGKEFGFGYEEVSNVCIHDPNKYENNKCLDERLLPFLKENLYLKDFDYTKIPGSFFPEAKSNYIAKSPKITCILVSHEKPEYCQQAIDSVKNQDMSDWQLIIVDSGYLINNNFFKETDNRIQVLKSGETLHMRSEKTMASWCFNKCFRENLINGELVMYLCDDDILYPNAFSTFVNYYEENPHCMAMLASQDIGVITKQGKEYITSERRATTFVGQCCSGQKLDCVYDYLQLCHKKELWNEVKWSEDKNDKNHADGIFMDKIGDIVAIHPIDIKIGVNRRTPRSLNNPS